MTLCSLPWLGFVPDDVASAPRAAVARLAGQLQVDPDALRSYGRRAKTRTEHLRLAAQYLGWRPAGPLELKELDEFLLARALEHDSPLLLFRLACEYLISARVIRPGPVTVVERVAHARERARREIFDRLADQFTEGRCAGLACDEDLYRILNESLSGSAHGSVGSVGSGDNDEVAQPRAISFMLVSGSSVPRFLR